MYIESVPNRNSPPAVLLRESYRQEGKFRQRVIASLGRLDRLLESASRLSESLMLLSAHWRGELSGVVSRRISPSPVFGRLWKRLGLD